MLKSSGGDEVVIAVRSKSLDDGQKGKTRPEKPTAKPLELVTPRFPLNIQPRSSVLFITSDYHSRSRSPVSPSCCIS